MQSIVAENRAFYVTVRLFAALIRHPPRVLRHGLEQLATISGVLKRLKNPAQREKYKRKQGEVNCIKVQINFESSTLYFFFLIERVKAAL